MITAVSLLGSVLTQEIIKGISLTGIPGFNVFILEGSNFSIKSIPIAELLSIVLFLQVNFCFF
jgi:hypothetical protein